ncbi:MAG: HAD-IC family P-type ATPase [Bacilli bacterium]|nr:HAD-IC family P-type ATPase [Bacilli bacterium]
MKMKKTKLNKEDIVRYEPSFESGLNNEQVTERKLHKLNNHTKIVTGKSYFEIILNDVFSFFNLVLFGIAALCISAKYFAGLFFMVILSANILISLYEDIKARRLMDKLRVLSEPKTIVIRDHKEEEIKVKDILLDDVVLLKGDSQISVDGPLLQGSLLVNESQLTGESENIAKKPGDMLYSGSFVVSGNGRMRAYNIGNDSYIESLANKAKKFKRSPSVILKSLRRLFRVLGSIVIIMAIATFIVYGVTGQLGNYQSFQESVKGISGSLISMIPSGLYLLTSVALAVAVINLSRKKARVQDFYSVEMLARTNVLCVDKTGTITDGTMKVVGVTRLDNSYQEDEIAQIMSNILLATQDDNLTAKALKEYFTYDLTKVVKVALPFNSDNKYSGATFGLGETYAFGAKEFLPMKKSLALDTKISEYTSSGHRVLVLGKSSNYIKNNKLDGEIKPIALIILEDHIREAAPRTFKWFKENDVQVKVISGDDAQTVSVVAIQAGIDGAEKFISLAGLSDEEVKEAATKYNVFGRVNPEQKETLVLALKEQNNTVAMTGDGVNDILALKRADCSIAMASGAESAKNVSHIVLLDSNFDSLPSVVDEGRRVINNLQRTASLFLVKTTFSVISSIVFLILLATIGLRYPFAPTHFYIWEDIALGIPAFFLALQKNSERIKGSFLKNILQKAIPAGLMIVFSVVIIYFLFMLQKFFNIYTGIYSYEAATAMAIMTFSIASLAALYKVCSPFDKYRLFVFLAASIIAVGWLIVDSVMYFHTDFFFTLDIKYESLNPVNLVVIAIVVVMTFSLYLLINRIISIKKGNN